jgi:hypothetical protein
MDFAGNLWMVDQDPNMVYLIDSGLPSFTDVPWLSETPTSGTLPVGGSVEIQVTAKTAGLGPGVYEAAIVIRTDSGRQPDLWVPVRLIVPAYFVGVNAGDLISETVLALEMGADAEDIGLTIHPHPTLSETIYFSAEMAEGTITDLMPKPRT